MSDKIRADDLINRGTEHQIKFVYSMITLALGTLALSFQFSTALQYQPGLLISSWTFLFVSVLLGGWRVYIAPGVFFLNAKMLYRPETYSSGKTAISKLSKISSWVYKIQIFFLVSGMFQLGLFTSINYLKSFSKA